MENKFQRKIDNGMTMGVIAVTCNPPQNRV
jgi:hypothetical protein